MRKIDLPFLTLADLFQLLENFADEEGTSFLYSGGNFDSAQNTFLFLFPYEKIILKAVPGCWEVFQSKLSLDSPFPEWVGYLTYEMGCFSDEDKQIRSFENGIPDCCFYRCACTFIYNHHSHKTVLYINEKWLPLSYKDLAWLKNREKNDAFKKSSLCIKKKSDTLESYSKKVLEVQEWIRAGEIYQVNLSQEFILEGETSPLAYFKKVISLNPAPFSAFVQCKEFTIVSSSPERLLSKKGNFLETRPIKGTVSRGKSFEEDIRNRHYLMISEKERAELLMITDLMRNDLGKIAQVGTVVTKALWQMETYTNVYHLLSIIEALVDPSYHPVEILKKVFPGGSVTGCPKLRAMDAITTFEGRERGLYTGSIGYFAGENFDFNIAIRTLTVHPHQVKIQLGGAITIDSDPQKEFEETLHKGTSLFTVLR